MAVNLIDSTDIKVVQDGSDIKLNFDSTNLNNIIDNEVSPLTIYSTTEQRVGTWIDGKPLYKRVLHDTLGTTNNTWKNIQLTAPNYIKYVVSLTAMFRYSNGNNYSIPFFRGTNDDYANREFCLCNIVPGDGTFNIIARHPNSYNIMSGQPFYAFIYYTKTSDYS